VNGEPLYSTFFDGLSIGLLVMVAAWVPLVIVYAIRKVVGA
jgi:hypothetical protein